MRISAFLSQKFPAKKNKKTKKSYYEKSFLVRGFKEAELPVSTSRIAQKKLNCKY